MDDAMVGSVLRAVRHRRGLRQIDVAHMAGVSQQTVSLVELGRLELLSLRSIRTVLAAAQVRLRLTAEWRGTAETARLLDRAHAGLVSILAGLLNRRGWAVRVEHTFSRFGERGAIDLLAWHPATRSILVIEAKTRIVDLQDTFAGLDRKARLAPGIARDVGWSAGRVSRVLVATDTTANRSAVAQHAAVFAAALPARSREVRSWLGRPTGAINGLWFVSATKTNGSNRDQVHARRVRRPTSRSAEDGTERPEHPRAR